MSNKMNTPPTIRWQLLCTVSAFALLASTCSASRALAATGEAGRPELWIELGGQLEAVSGQGEIFAPSFLSTYRDSPVLQNVTPLQAQRPPMFSFGAEGRLSFQPEGSDWIFSAGVRYGRSSNFRHVHHQTSRVFKQPFKYGTGTSITTVEKFSDTQSRRNEKHTVLDFSAGKDVGLGLFGRESSSVLSVGVRFAQFESNTTFNLRARPDLTTHYKYYGSYVFSMFPPLAYFHTYHATGHTLRNFRGIGPSLSWNGSAAMWGDKRSGAVEFDWGVNAALLFGKQRTNILHHESGHYKADGNKNAVYELLYQNLVDGHVGLRSVTVPNVGGFAGVSWRVEDFKVSLGYRADFFFGAVDGGIDVRKSETLGFKGPFASVSVGLGD